MESYEKKPNLDFPNQETKYQQTVEEMKQLIPFLQEEMKTCPVDDLTFNLIETVDFYSLKRHFNFKSKSSNKNDKAINIFKQKFLTSLSTFDSFVVIPLDQSSSSIDNRNNKGNKFKSPKVFDINGDEGLISGGETEIYLFLYDNMIDLNLFLSKNINTNLTCYCLGINMNFFETKKWIKNNGLLNKNNFCFYFLSNTSEKDINLKINNLPRIAVIGPDETIIEDKNIKNLEKFKLNEYFMYNNNKNKNQENQKEESKFIFLENDNKRKIIKSINIYLKSAGLDEVYFYVKSKISFDKNGIKKIRCYPAFYGEASKSEKKMVINLVDTLNKQELFKDVQNQVNYEHTILSNN